MMTRTCCHFDIVEICLFLLVCNFYASERKSFVKEHQQRETEYAGENIFLVTWGSKL